MRCPFILLGWSVYSRKHTAQDEDGPADEPWWPGAKDNEAIVRCSDCYNYLAKYWRDHTVWTINRWCEACNKRNVQVRACARRLCKYETADHPSI